MEFRDYPEAKQSMRSTRMIVSEEALFQNAKAIRGIVPENVKLMCVVKADAYGHGSVRAAKAMIRAGADAFAVAIVEEAEVLRAAGIDLPILILGGAEAESLRMAVRLDAAQAVYTAYMLDVLQDEAQKLGKKALAHLKIDTGMRRIGVRGEEDLDVLLKHWKENCPDVEMAGMFTHYCAADCDEEFTRLQNARFRAAIDRVHAAGFAPIVHGAATSALARGDFQYDMVRAGIALYGTLLDELKGQLQYAQRLVCRPVRMERIEAGDTVGYGRTFKAERDMRIMTLPIGYGDGYPRLLSNRADVLVCGKRAKVVGNVCMDMIMADVTDIPEADMGSEVVLMGEQGNERITPDELAGLTNTIPYEIMLGFHSRVPRVYVADEA